MPRKVESVELSEVIRHTPAKKDHEKKHGKSKMADNEVKTTKKKVKRRKKRKVSFQQLLTLQHHHLKTGY